MYFWSQDPRVVISEWIKRTTFNVISKRLSKGLAIVCTRRGPCQSVRDCFDVSDCLSVASAWFGQKLSQWRCRRESIFNHPPITHTGINVPHTHVGWQFCFFSQDCSAFFMSHVYLCCVSFSVTRRYWFFSGVPFVVKFFSPSFFFLLIRIISDIHLETYRELFWRIDLSIFFVFFPQYRTFRDSFSDFFLVAVFSLPAWIFRDCDATALRASLTLECARHLGFRKLNVHEWKARWRVSRKGNWESGVFSVNWGSRF